jgi:hypothetical protein
MKKFFCISLIFLFFFAAVGQAQPLYLHWTKFFGGTLSEVVHDAIPSNNGSIVFTGLACSIDGDIPSSPPDTNNSLRYNLMVGKIDSNKQLSWVKIYRGQRKDHGYCVINLLDGGYAVLGSTESSDGDVSWNRGSEDIWLLRLDANGDLLWQRTFGSTYSDQPLSLTQTADSSFVILGRSNGFDYDVPFHYGTSQFDYDFLVLKVNSSGELIWSKTIGGYGDEGLEGSIFEVNGGYYFASFSNSKDNDCVDTSWCQGTYTGNDCYLFFLDTSGTVQWAKSYGGSEGDGFRRAFFDVRDSTIILVGTTGSTDYMVTQNNWPQVSSLWVVKTDLNGNLIWEKRMGDTAATNFDPSITAVDGGYMVSCGEEEDNQQTYHIGQDDVVLRLLDTAGTILAEKMIGGLKVERLASAVPYKQGYAVVGYTGSYTFIEGVNENTNHTSAFQSDVFISAVNDFLLEIRDLKSRSESEIKVYPNPAKEKITIELPANDIKGILTIRDGQGKLVYKEKQKNATKVDIDISGWAKGGYVVQWIGKAQYAVKLIIR